MHGPVPGSRAAGLAAGRLCIREEGGCADMTWEAKPEPDIDLNPSRPVCRRPEESPLADGSGPKRKCR